LDAAAQLKESEPIMRSTFIRTLADLAEQDERILLLTADLGYTVLETFANRFPNRFFNVGVAEQNMLGMATGLAEAGFLPFVYSIATFATLRGYEFFRNGAIMQKLPVRVIAIGGGLEYSTAGLTHNNLEGIGVMRLQPGLRVLVPADSPQTRAALLATWDLPEPIYYGVGKNDNLIIPELGGSFALESPQWIGDGGDLLIVTAGSITAEVVKVAHLLNSEGIQTTLGVVASLNPPPLLADKLAAFQQVMTVEDHYITGGIGSLVAEIIAEHGLGCQLTRCGARDLSHGISGSLESMRRLHGLTIAQLVETAHRILQHATP
jgi:transketolase